MLDICLRNSRLVASGIEYDQIWDGEVLSGGLADYEWLHLHHEDFTGQYSKFYLTYAGSPWLTEMVQMNTSMMRAQGFDSVPALKKAVALRIKEFVGQKDNWPRFAQGRTPLEVVGRYGAASPSALRLTK